MKPFTHILVPTDFSPPSRAAIEAATSLAGQLGAELTVLHVVEPQFAAYGGMPLLPVVNFASEAEQAARGALRELEKDLEGKVKLTTTVRHGSPWREVLEEVTACDADLIVIGTHGHTGLARALIGSTAEKVVRMSSVPVLTVHGPAQP